MKDWPVPEAYAKLCPMRYAAPLILALGLACPALAGQPMTGDEFERYTKGKTLYYGEGGQAYGVEEYLDGRRVRWSFLDGVCKDGIWYEESNMICFVYEDDLDPQCWSFFQESSGLTARFENNSEAQELYEVQQSDEPMYCMGPDVGV